MAIRIEKKTVSVVEIELRDIPYVDWPEDMKAEALAILSIPYFKRQFLEQLECFRKEWLVRKIEDSLTLQAEFNDWVLKEGGK